MVIIKLVEVCLKLLLYVSISLAVYSFLYLIGHKSININVFRTLDKFSENYEKRLLLLRYRQYYSSKRKGKRILEELDILIEKTNIKRLLPFVSAEVFFIISILVFIGTFIVTFILLLNIIAALVLAGFSFFIMIYTLKLIAYRNSIRVDKQLVFYIDVLKNFCYINDDIVFAFAKSIQYLREPLKSYNLALINEVRHGIPVFDALESLKRKVGNQKFKLFIKNLQLCTKYKGSYVQVLSKTRDTLKRYEIERDRRKREVRKQRTSIYIMIIFSVFIIYGLIQMSPELEVQLRNKFIGQMLVVYELCAIIFSLYKSLTMEKLEY